MEKTFREGLMLLRTLLYLTIAVFMSLTFAKNEMTKKLKQADEKTTILLQAQNEFDKLQFANRETYHDPFSRLSDQYDRNPKIQLAKVFELLHDADADIGKLNIEHFFKETDYDSVRRIMNENYWYLVENCDEILVKCKGPECEVYKNKLDGYRKDMAKWDTTTTGPY